MFEVHRILDQLRRAWNGEAFHGPAIGEILGGVGAEAAFAQPLPAGHSIAEVTLHIATWEDIIRRRLAGEAIDTVPDDQDWPPAGQPGAHRWEAIRSQAVDAHRNLERAVEALPEARLDEAVAARDYDVRYMLSGILQHSLYHAGQISLLKKAAEAGVR